MKKIVMGVALALLLAPALVALLPDWGGIVYGWPVVGSRTFQA